MNKATFRLEFDNSNGKGEGREYNMEAICNSAIYTKELEGGQLLGFYYLVL